MSTDVLCSFLIPSRARPERLFKTITSIFNAGDSIGKNGFIDVWVRLDDDDQISLAHLSTLQNWAHVNVIVGKRMKGYASLDVMYNELALAASGKWVWIMNDDACFEMDPCSPALISQIFSVPLNGYLIHPQIQQFNSSKYIEFQGQDPFPAVPRLSWLSLLTDGHDRLQDPIDHDIDQLYRVKNGWKIFFIKGLNIVHLRDSDADLEAHRKLH